MKSTGQLLRPPSSQSGFVLMFSLVILMLMTLLAITALHLGTDQTVIVANSQHKNEGIDAAQLAIETVVNSANFTINPAAAIPSSNCSTGGANKVCVDSNGDGHNDFTVSLTPQPTCVEAAPILVNQLNFTNAEDLACSVQTQQTFGVANANTNANSLCANSTWEINAQAEDTATNTKVSVAQGASVKIAATDMASNCP